MARPQTAELPRKLAHVRGIGQGNRGWGGDAVWSMQGADPSVSFYDVAEGSEQSNLGHSIGGNVQTSRSENPASMPTTTREARSSVFSSVPAARFFQGYFSPSFSWLDNLNPTKGQLPHTPLAINFNPNMQGALELDPATVYNPFPPGGSLWPKAI